MQQEIESNFEKKKSRVDPHAILSLTEQRETIVLDSSRRIIPRLNCLNPSRFPNLNPNNNAEHGN